MELQPNEQIQDGSNPFRSCLLLRERTCGRGLTLQEILEFEVALGDSVVNNYWYCEQDSTVANYYEEFNDWKRWAAVYFSDEDSEAVVVSIFLRGLTEDIRKRMASSSPRTLTEAYLNAITIEISLEVSAKVCTTMKKMFDELTQRLNEFQQAQEDRPKAEISVSQVEIEKSIANADIIEESCVPAGFEEEQESENECGLQNDVLFIQIENLALEENGGTDSVMQNHAEVVNCITVEVNKSLPLNDCCCEIPLDEKEVVAKLVAFSHDAKLSVFNDPCLLDANWSTRLKFGSLDKELADVADYNFQQAIVDDSKFCQLCIATTHTLFDQLLVYDPGGQCCIIEFTVLDGLLATISSRLVRVFNGARFNCCLSGAELDTCMELGLVIIGYENINSIIKQWDDTLRAEILIKYGAHVFCMLLDHVNVGHASWNLVCCPQIPHTQLADHANFELEKASTTPLLAIVNAQEQVLVQLVNVYWVPKDKRSKKLSNVELLMSRIWTTAAPSIAKVLMFRVQEYIYLSSRISTASASSLEFSDSYELYRVQNLVSQGVAMDSRKATRSSALIGKLAEQFMFGWIHSCTSVDHASWTIVGCPQIQEGSELVTIVYYKETFVPIFSKFDWGETWITREALRQPTRFFDVLDPVGVVFQFSKGLGTQLFTSAKLVLRIRMFSLVLQAYVASTILIHLAYIAHRDESLVEVIPYEVGYLLKNASNLAFCCDGTEQASQLLHAALLMRQNAMVKCWSRIFFHKWKEKQLHLESKVAFRGGDNVTEAIARPKEDGLESSKAELLGVFRRMTRHRFSGLLKESACISRRSKLVKK